MAIFSSTQPSIRARILPRFPAQVLAGTGITITKSGGTYIFASSGGSSVPEANVRVITDAAPIVVAETDSAIVLDKAVAAATSVALPTVESRSGRQLIVVDFAGNGGDITITPASGERIMGQAADATWVLTSGGAGLGGQVTLLPVKNGAITLGWVVI